MAYSDYGAEVYRNGIRRNDKEDAPLFITDKEAFGESIENIPNSMRIFAYLLNNKDFISMANRFGHGIMGDDSIRVLCYKVGLPQIFELTENEVQEVVYKPEDIDWYEDSYDVSYEYKNYKFHFFGDGTPYTAIMIEPNGNKWECNYGCGYGAGFEDEE